MALPKQDEEVRRGPWTEQEDAQLVWFVRLFGERRWDLLAKVSGLNRTGKSCRLRWVNYLNPGLRRGRMTPEEEHLVLELHAQWGNRWSRIARRLPGRTDNEIKNYWRTHMRKQAQERKRSLRSSSPPFSSSCSYSSSSSNVDCSINEPVALTKLGADMEHETDVAAGGSGSFLAAGFGSSEEDMMDQIWNEIGASNSGSELSFEAYDDAASACDGVTASSMPSPIWQDCSVSLWSIDDDELIKMLPGFMSSNKQYSKEPNQHA